MSEDNTTASMPGDKPKGVRGKAKSVADKIDRTTAKGILKILREGRTTTFIDKDGNETKVVKQPSAADFRAAIAFLGLNLNPRHQRARQDKDAKMAEIMEGIRNRNRQGRSPLKFPGAEAERA